jgi:hypothetical protein
MFGEHITDVARTEARCFIRGWYVGRELVCDWAILESSDCEVLILAAENLGLSDKYSIRQRDAYSIPTVIQGTIDPFCVGNTHCDFSTALIRRGAGVNVRAVSSGTMVFEESYCVRICFVPARIESRRVRTRRRIEQESGESAIHEKQKGKSVEKRWFQHDRKYFYKNVDRESVCRLILKIWASQNAC